MSVTATNLNCSHFSSLLRGTVNVPADWKIGKPLGKTEKYICYFKKTKQYACLATNEFKKGRYQGNNPEYKDFKKLSFQDLTKLALRFEKELAEQNPDEVRILSAILHESSAERTQHYSKICCLRRWIAKIFECIANFFCGRGFFTHAAVAKRLNLRLAAKLPVIPKSDPEKDALVTLIHRYNDSKDHTVMEEIVTQSLSISQSATHTPVNKLMAVFQYLHIDSVPAFLQLFVNSTPLPQSDRADVRFYQCLNALSLLQSNNNQRMTPLVTTCTNHLFSLQSSELHISTLFHYFAQFALLDNHTNTFATLILGLYTHSSADYKNQVLSTILTVAPQLFANLLGCNVILPVDHLLFLKDWLTQQPLTEEDFQTIEKMFDNIIAEGEKFKALIAPRLTLSNIERCLEENLFKLLPANNQMTEIKKRLDTLYQSIQSKECLKILATWIASTLGLASNKAEAITHTS